MSSRINLQPMRATRDAVEHDDNWTGLTDAKARRRRQNRLNQRASRRRKEQALARPAGVQQQLYFPLSVDHLLTLIQFNAYRAFLTNMEILSLPSMFSCEVPTSLVAASCAASLGSLEPAFFSPSPIITPTPTPPERNLSLPPSLYPTPLQLSLAHEPWVDLFPLPAFRDNLLRFRGRIDSCDLCDDILGTMFDDEIQPSPESDRNGVIVWGEPWDVGSWELMEGFVAKWGFLLAGCEALIEVSNRWRARRGEGPLVAIHRG
ncbi:hypothetical protein BJY01DRAFT_241654 [Aspergillus pseudoustus]|uniref:BZIP domain-containing protein n=1 Tax=Aspergillus pseudoustus TaxID=1810923 RepID=A0ABR4ICW8_9EURO